MTQPKRRIHAFQFESRRRFWPAILVTLVVMSAVSAASQSARGERESAGWRSGIVQSVAPAPVVPDGATAGHVTDFVINLAVDMNPAAAGRSLAAGRTIRVTLPRAFQRDPSIPFRTLLTDPGCVPGNIHCNTIFLLQGWPQHPVGFPPANMPGLWTVGFEETTNTVVLTALQDLIANPPTEPGIKQIHLLLAGFANPAPGLYHVGVVAETGPGGEAEGGWGRLLVRPGCSPTSPSRAPSTPARPIRFTRRQMREARHHFRMICCCGMSKARRSWMLRRDRPARTTPYWCREIAQWAASESRRLPAPGASNCSRKRRRSW